MAAITDTFNRGFDEGFGQDILDESQVGASQPNIAVKVDSTDISGGSTSNITAQASAQIEKFSAEGGGALPIVFGEAFIAGFLIVHEFIEGTPNQSRLFIALGDGEGTGGGHGRWDSAIAVYYAGRSYGVSPDDSTAGYRFYDGSISSAVDSGNQTVDAYFTDNLTYSGTVYVAVRLTNDDANEGDTPNKVMGRYKGRRTFDFDATGRRLSATPTYSVNPARVAADRILAYYERKFPNDAATALRLCQEKIDWESWVAWRDYNDELISWFNGTTTVDIPRFECHLAITGDMDLATVLDLICSTCGAFWQDTGERIRFIPPIEADPIHHFDESNIISDSVNFQPRDLRERPNFFVAEFRDLDDQFLGMSPTEVRRESSKRQVGEIKSTRAFPNMRKSQADRLLERMARLEADNPDIVTFSGDVTSMRVTRGDFVTVSLASLDWTYQRCLALSSTLVFGEDGAIRNDLVLQKITAPLYSDTAHGPRQEVLTP